MRNEQMGNDAIRKESMTSVLSEAISLLRFPMAFLVVLIHTDDYYKTWPANLDLMWGGGLSFLLGYSVRLIGGIAVPTFFVISGYLFFNNFRVFSWNGYREKMKSRVKTLVVPYLLWNVLIWGVLLAERVINMYNQGESWGYVMNFLAEKNYHFLWDIKQWGVAKHPWLWWTTYTTSPIDGPLWFLRDLIVVTVLSPLIYWSVKNLKKASVLILLVAYVLDFWVVWHGFKITAFFYFTLGAYFAINGKNIVEFCVHYRKAILTAAVMFFVVVSFRLVPQDYNSIFKNLFFVFGMFSAFYVISYLVIEKRLLAIPLLVQSSFFIYACHGAALPKALVDSVRNFLYALIPGDTYLERISCYFIVPVITVTILLIAYKMLMRWLPNAGKLFCGGR